MRTEDLAEDIENAASSGMPIIIWESQHRGSPAAYEILGWEFTQVEDEDANPLVEECAACGGSGVFEADEGDAADGIADVGDEILCNECDGSGEIESDEIPKKEALAIKIGHIGYAPDGLRA